MKSSIIASYLNTKLYCEDIEILTFSTLSECKSQSVVFAKKYSQSAIDSLSNRYDILAIVSCDYKDKIKTPHIISDNPRLDYLRVIKAFFAPKVEIGGMHPSSYVESGAQIGKDVSIGAHGYIGKDVQIGDRTNIHHNVTIIGPVSIGSDCIIKSGAVIGEEGFGFEVNEEGIPEHFPHLGKIQIGNHVFIGSNSTIERATLGTTQIDDHVKIDDLVQIGHNSHIGQHSMITVGAIICGGVNIESDCYIAPNVTIREKLNIGSGGFLGMGSVVVKNVEHDTTVVGNPAKAIMKN